MECERSELKASYEAVRVGVEHVFEGQDHVALRGHVVRYVVVHYQTEQSVQQGQVDLIGGGGGGEKGY